MNRDSLLYTLIGLLTGFIGGFMMHEAMDSRQPAPAFVGLGQQAVPGGMAPSGPSNGAPSSGAPAIGGAGGPQAAMQQVQQLRQHVEENPQDLDALKLLANLNQQIRNNSRAAELYQRYLQQRPNDVEVLRAYANMSYDSQNWQQAAQLYEEVLRLAPSLEVRTDLGATYRYLGRYQDALTQFERVQVEDPSHWQAHYNEVLVLAVDLKDYVGAEEALVTLKELLPGNAEVQELAAEVERLRSGA